MPLVPLDKTNLPDHVCVGRLTATRLHVEGYVQDYR